ncbi:predicted protein [Histoplasma mississippiense (nom. inval.)]|uniref:predicted protein n=1 Tax=Ajellomyces capsulatus (strain NAm1 / WU24) TaxID=2059318 RepID=UPI000157B6FB|nr:predicted protein [Histoplasma mississippiense (nom. inval.)]EDN03858.1 predicted protein [Histoplasma mississippiense (nom. inval.)]
MASFSISSVHRSCSCFANLYGSAQVGIEQHQRSSIDWEGPVSHRLPHPVTKGVSGQCSVIRTAVSGAKAGIDFLYVQLSFVNNAARPIVARIMGCSAPEAVASGLPSLLPSHSARLSLDESLSV